MQPTHETRKHTGPTLPALSIGALANVSFPLADNPLYAGRIEDGRGNRFLDVTGWNTSATQDAEWAAHITALLNSLYAPTTHICEYDDCDQLALPGYDWCAEHKAEHDQLMLEEVEPETTIEERQAVTAQLESATLSAQYTAANDARREG